MRRLTIFITVFFFSLPLFADLPLEKLELPAGFSIHIFSDQVPDAREMALGNKGTVFVGTRDKGKVYAIINDPQNPQQKKVITIASGLDNPNGVAFRNGSLYVAEVSRIIRFDDIENRLNNPPQPVVINNNFPIEQHHGWKFIRFSPDGMLYIPVGAPCNLCLKDDPRFASIMRMQPDGSNLEIYAKGVRNSVGFDWDPLTHKLWFTENGADWMGDDLPPDELDYAPQKGLDFGFPFYHGNHIPDPKYGKMRSADDFTWPSLNLPAHVAALGLEFYTGKMFSPEYQNQIIIAEHGSWNRSKKVGYQLILVKLKDKQAISWQPFVTGWLQGQTAWGRPVATLQMPDGSLLVSDDYAGVIYRISYKKT